VSDPARRSFDIASMPHGNPIPSVTRMGPLVVSSIIAARNAGSTEVPESLADQLENLFSHAGEILTAAGAGWEHVVRMNFFLPSLDDRTAVNVPWLRHFPDPESRPTRHTQVGSAPYAQCDVWAYVPTDR
jgi:enamine deaminase RidA (YjgF/YER057c/UK114 family)